MKIGIIGGGTVGAATAFVLQKDHDVRVWDIAPERATAPLAKVLEADVLLVCLPTPMHNSMGVVDSFLSSIPAFPGIVAVRSTVPVGYCEMASARHGLTNLVHWPEFLTARKAKEDAANPRMNLLGLTESARASGTAVERLYHGVIRRQWTNCYVMVMRSQETELVKLAQNAFSATKIAFFNELRRLSDAYGLGWDDILYALKMQGWINPMHTEVPGPDGKRGFGGACLPKDLLCLIECCELAGVGAPLMAAAFKRNQEIDRGNE